MADTIHASPAAVSYAKSLLELASEQGTDSAIGSELSELSKAISGNSAFGLYLSDPSISGTERGEVLKRSLGAQVSPLMMNFVGLLNEKKRLNLLHEIAEAYANLLDQKVGKVEVDVTVAQKLDAQQMQRAHELISKALGRDAVVNQHVDERIIGGVVIRVQDKLIDGSVKAQLESMKERLMAAAPR